MGKIKILIQTIFKADNAYCGEGMMLALYFTALLFIMFLVQDKKKEKSLLVSQIFCIMVLYTFIPFASVFIRPMEFFDGRLFWLLFTPFITAVGMTEFIKAINEKGRRIIALILLVPVIFYCGRFAISNDTYKKAENMYRLPQCTIDITEYVLAEKETPKLIVPYTISYAFRQISTDVHLMFGEDATSARIFGARGECFTICDELEREIPDLNLILELADDDTDYILFDTVYTEFCKDGNINIYDYEPDKRYVGDRTPNVTYEDLPGIVVVDENDPHWDLSAYSMDYCGRFGQYVLYRFNK